MDMELIFATGNAGKVMEAQQICDALEAQYGVKVTVVPMPEKLDIPETGDSYAENSRQKAEFVWKRYGKNCFADDSGLEVDVLGGAPGIHTARYCDRNFASGMDKLLHEMEQAGATEDEKDRRGAFQCCITLVVDGKYHRFDGCCPGHIATAKKGSEGFGFDPVFISDAYPGRTLAELPAEVKNPISHRGRAMEKMFGFLKELQEGAEK